MARWTFHTPPQHQDPDTEPQGLKSHSALWANATHSGRHPLSLHHQGPAHSQDPSPLFLYAGLSTSLFQALMVADDRDNTSPTSSSSPRPKLKPRVELRLKAREQLTSTKWDNSRWFFALLPCPSASSLLVIVNCVTQAKKGVIGLVLSH
ncbi:hypothetical protein LXA43DRAFT_1068212 [Ganoderma leucocontextum]|nr:hypothetical protein LXA43DRAFT_1068212 [Ganoderma leucocontextum]